MRNMKEIMLLEPGQRLIVKKTLTEKTLTKALHNMEGTAHGHEGEGETPLVLNEAELHVVNNAGKVSTFVRKPHMFETDYVVDVSGRHVHLNSEEIKLAFRKVNKKWSVCIAYLNIRDT